MTHVLRLIQIGDIHFTDADAFGGAADWKDDAFPADLGKAIATPPAQSVTRAIMNICDREKDSIAGILICGDLANRGSLSAYVSCVRYLSRALRFEDGRWDVTQVHAVPGNHDVDRERCDPADRNLHKKFEPLIEAWTKLGLDILAARQARHSRVTANGHALDVFSLNSCIGCGERRYLPKDIKDGLHGLLHPKAGSLDLIWEQLDTPAFLEADVNEVTTKIEGTSDCSLALVVAHHNLLSQAKPRLEVYTELVNGGLVRSRLSQCSRPVIYCHGHIHDDPVEVVLNPKSEGGRLVSVSTPKFADGFNVIELHYSRDNFPIGCSIIPHRLQNDGSVRQVEPVRVPLHTAQESKFLADDLAKHALENLEGWMKFEDLRKAVAAAAKPAPIQRTLAHVSISLFEQP